MKTLEPVCPQKLFIGSLSRLRIGIMPKSWTWVHWKDEFYPPELLPLSIDAKFHPETASLQYREAKTPQGNRKSEVAIEFDSLLSRSEVSAFLEPLQGQNLFAICFPADGSPANVLLPLVIESSSSSGRTYSDLPASTLRLTPRGLVKNYFIETPANALPQTPTFDSFSDGFDEGYS